MAIKSYRPTTPTRRFQTSVARTDITKEIPEKSLVEPKKRTVTYGKPKRGALAKT